jgi:hypothetical protein
MSPLLGGELVIAFLALRITLWVWRSRHQLGAAFGGDTGPRGPHGGVPLPPQRPALRLAPPAAAAASPPGAERVSLPRAA